MGVIDEVKQRADIVEVVSQYTALAKAGRTFRGLCPFHGEKHASFFVYPEQQSWHCFGACNTGGDVFSFIMKKEGLDFGETLRLLANRVGVTLPTRPELKTEGRERLYQANQAAAQYFHNLLLNAPAAKNAREYVSRRGLSPKATADFQLGFSLNSWEALKQHLMERGYTEKELLGAGLVIAGEAGKTHDRFRNFLMFPIFDDRGRTAGFGARVLDDSQPKYINSPQTLIFDKSSILYGINLAKSDIRQQDLAVIVEGYMDAIIAHENGFQNVVASMGTAVTEKQVSTLKRLTRNIALALDADTAGEEAMLRGVGFENTLGAEVKVIVLPDGKDPDEVIKEDASTWPQLVSEALPVIDYTINMVTANLDLTTARDKSKVADKLLPIIKAINDPLRLAHYRLKLARLFQMSEQDVEAALSRIKSDRKSIESKEKTVVRALQPLLSSPVEEYCLALLLQHPELKASCQDLAPEYFQSSQNREIFTACQQAEDLTSLKEKLDATIHEHLDALTGKSLLTTRIEQRWSECALRLREIFLRSLEAKRREVLALEAEIGGTAAELAKLEEQGIEVSIQLGEVFVHRSRTRSGAKGERNEPR
ncbi:DNA primase [Chloroflexota bacterium]